MITAENITSQEFIGLDTEIVQSSNPQNTGLNGKIIDETRSMFKISTTNGVKLIAKAENSWKFSFKDRDIVIAGSKIAKRPFDRIGGRT